MFSSSRDDCPPPLITHTATAKWKFAGIEKAPNCPRCASTNTKFCYYNNYSLSQPRYYCKACRRYWTKGGSLRNVPVGGGTRKARRARAAPKCVDPAEESSGTGSSDNHRNGMAAPVGLGSGGDCDPQAMIDGQDLGGAICDHVGPGDLWSDDCGPQIQPTMHVQDFRSISTDDQFGLFENLAADNNWAEIFSDP